MTETLTYAVFTKRGERVSQWFIKLSSAHRANSGKHVVKDNKGKAYIEA